MKKNLLIFVVIPLILSSSCSFQKQVKKEKFISVTSNLGEHQYKKASIIAHEESITGKQKTTIKTSATYSFNQEEQKWKMESYYCSSDTLATSEWGISCLEQKIDFYYDYCPILIMGFEIKIKYYINPYQINFEVDETLSDDVVLMEKRQLMFNKFGFLSKQKTTMKSGSKDNLWVYYATLNIKYS